MLKRTVNGIVSCLGYEVRRIHGVRRNTSAEGFTVYSFSNKDGSFDYDRYRRIQTEGNKRKLNQTWAKEENIAFLSQYIKRTLGAPRFGICHGTRRGKEQEWFRKGLACDVIGTEISDTACQFPHTIQWDFHNTKPEWINQTDFIYSNALDHSYDPHKCLNAWMSCVRPGGLCILEHSNAHSPDGATELDPFGADLTLMPYLILDWSCGRYAARELLKAPYKSDEVQYLFFIIIQKF